MPSQSRARQGQYLRIVDEARRFVTRATAVTLRSVQDRDTAYTASSRGGTAVEYLLDVPRGDYDVAVTSRGYLPYRRRIPVGSERTRTITVTLTEKGEAEQGNAVERAYAGLSDTRAYPSRRIPGTARQDAIDQKRRTTTPPGSPPPPRAKWTVLGPRNISGRVRALAAHPTAGETLYAGTANAGVWVTGNGGRTWRSLWFEEAVLEVGALAIHLTDPAQPNGDVTLYAGTGTIEFADPTIFPAYPGIGILKSTNNGAAGSWTTIAVPLTDVTAIVVDPGSVSADHSKIRLYAGGSGGLYESKNGGAGWNQLMTANIRSLALDPSDPQSLYAGVAGQGIRRINRTTLAVSAFNNNVSDTSATSNLVAIGQSSPFTIYAKYDAIVYRYNRQTMQWENLGAHGGDTYGFWNECLAVDPTNSSIVLSGGVGLERSSDGGESWSSVALDSDHHAIAFSSTNPLTVYAANDHGVRKGSYAAADQEVTWEEAHNGLILMHYNGLGSSGAGPNVIGGGAQDNGTHRTVGGLTWDRVKGGRDGGGFLYDPDDPYTMYYAESIGLGKIMNGEIYRTTDGGESETEGDTSNFTGPFVTPLVIDPDSPSDSRILFAGDIKKVFRSADSGMTWSASSPNLGAEVRTLSVSPRSSAVMYAGTVKVQDLTAGGVWRSTDGGAAAGNWKQITPGAGVPMPDRRITSVLADPFDTYGVYVTCGGFNSATPAAPGHLFHGLSTDSGNTYTWKNRSGNLPDIPAYSVALDPGDSKRMWIGTDIGVFESADGGATWIGDDGLPNVVVTELRVREAGDVLRAATYGWGMWQRRIRPPYSPVDLYVRDNKMDTGETSPSPYGVDDPQVVGAKLYFWESPDIKVSLDPAPIDGVEFDKLVEVAAQRETVNPLYVQVHNRGWMPLANVTVKALWAEGAAGLPPLPGDFWSSFPGNWANASDWKPVDANVPFQTIPKLLPHTPAILTWSWFVPFSASADSCVLVVVSASQDPVTRSDANPDDLQVDTVSVWDKHVAHRNVQVTGLEFLGAGIARDITAAEIPIALHNPYDHPDYFYVDIDRGTLPKEARVDVRLPRGAAAQSGSYRVLIPARSKIKAGITVTLPSTVRPGASFRFSVIQRLRTRLVGGSSYQVRVPPAVIRIGPPAPASGSARSARQKKGTRRITKSPASRRSR